MDGPNNIPENDAWEDWLQSPEFDSGASLLDSWAEESPAELIADWASSIDEEMPAAELPSSDELAALLGTLSSLDPLTHSPTESADPTTELPARSTIDAESAVDRGVGWHEEAAACREQGDCSPGQQVAGGVLDPEMREAFLDDASVCMGAIEAAVMQLDGSQANHEALIQINRNLHTLKGASASIGLSEVADRLHNLEETLREDQSNGKLTPTDMLLDSLDWFRFQLSTLGGQPFGDALSAGLANPGLANPDHTNPDHTNPSPGTLGPATTGAGITTPGILSAGMPGAAIGSPNTGSIAVPKLSMDSTSEDDESVRVRSSQLNRLMDMLAELVMLRNRRQTEISDLREIYHELMGTASKLRAISSNGAHCGSEGESSQLTEVTADVLEMAQRVRACTRPVAEGNEAVSQFIRNFRQELVELRRAPAAGLFQRLKRAIHDAARAESKSVSIECLGTATAIERNLQQRLFEPLLHVVRNAVCHGIETAEERQRKSKAPVGRITLEAASTADLLVIEVRDDGGGLNYQAIRKKAIQSGLLANDQTPSEQELAQLIFHPGFSTRDSADRQAGRGIGMDVVAVTLQRLGGWFEVESTPSAGTTIRLSIPLPSAIEHLMLFRFGSQLYAVPMLAIKNAGAQDRSAGFLHCGEVFERPEQTAIGQPFMGQGAQPPSSEGKPSLVLDWEPLSKGRNHSESAHINLIVDEILGPEEVVVRPLPPLLRHHPYCSGATISAGGQLVIVLDVRRLAARFPCVDRASSRPQSNIAPRTDRDMSEQTSPQPSSGDRRPVADVDAKRTLSGNVSSTAQPCVLVVDDSVSSRRLVVRILSKYPFRVVEAADGRQALQLLKSQRFAAVFSDLEMPFVDGLELLAEIRSRDSIKHTPFTIISSRTDAEVVQRAESLGVVRYLSKPATEEGIQTALQNIETLCKVSPRTSIDTHSGS
jgi:chemosensory pili system protein ChpA (sensor histidine kinase/response regulator)